MDKIYEKIKSVLQVEEILALTEEIKQKASDVEDESPRRNLYSLMGFLKSELPRN